MRRAKAASMFSLGLSVSLVFLLSSSTLLFAGQSFLRAAAETNVNQRYTIESVSIAGVKVENAKIPLSLRRRMTALVGERCDTTMLEDLAGDLRRQLHFQAVNHHLSKGSEPGRIRVNFDVIRKDVGFDLSVPKFLYSSSQGWTGEVDASTHVREHEFTVGAINNGDTLPERFSGVTARYEDSRVGSDRVRFGIAFENLHEQWSDQARAAATGEAELYRTRRNIAPELTVAVAKNVTVSAGMSFEQLDSQSANTRSANALTGEIHYGSKIEGGTAQQMVDAKYSVRVGVPKLGSDYSYSRHMVTLRYEVKSGRQSASDEFLGGMAEGDAPLFERFVLGNSSTLRGWDAAAIAPLGANRVAHNSLTWGYQMGEGTAEVFYDAGALWRTGRPAPMRHSLGLGYRQKMFFMTMAFPITEGRMSPVFMAGMIY
ncbi:MAG: BamA/TamA family outer membrane protein [Terriglobia bacterium]